MILFVRHNCAYSSAVLAQVDMLGLDVIKKYIDDDQKHEEELLSRGGRVQVPYLVDEASEVELYDSDLILHYLDEHYGKEKQK